MWPRDSIRLEKELQSNAEVFGDQDDPGINFSFLMNRHRVQQKGKQRADVPRTWAIPFWTFYHSAGSGGGGWAGGSSPWWPSTARRRRIPSPSRRRRRRRPGRLNWRKRTWPPFLSRSTSPSFPLSLFLFFSFLPFHTHRHFTIDPVSSSAGCCRTRGPFRGPFRGPLPWDVTAVGVLSTTATTECRRRNPGTGSPSSATSSPAYFFGTRRKRNQEEEDDDEEDEEDEEDDEDESSAEQRRLTPGWLDGEGPTDGHEVRRRRSSPAPPGPWLGVAPPRRRPTRRRKWKKKKAKEKRPAAIRSSVVHGSASSSSSSSSPSPSFSSFRLFTRIFFYDGGVFFFFLQRPVGLENILASFLFGKFYNQNGRFRAEIASDWSVFFSKVRDRWNFFGSKQKWKMCEICFPQRPNRSYGRSISNVLLATQISDSNRSGF